MNNSEHLKYIIYTRKSQEARDKQVLSLNSQLNELRQFARKENLHIVEELKESQTAFKPGRPIFSQMMEYLNSGVANAVLVWKPDRISRNAVDTGRFIQAMDDGKIMEIKTPFETIRKDDNRMMLYIHFGMSNDDSRQISANVKRGNREKYRRGEFVGQAPLGYLNDLKTQGSIKIDPDKAPLVIKLFEEYSTGKYSVNDMIKKAKTWGLKSKNDKDIAKSGMYTLLRRSAYYGLYKHAGEHHQGAYKPLISKELFDKVQLVLDDRGKPRKKDWSIHAYKGNLIKCAYCGCAITATTKVKHYEKTGNTGVYTYYHCTKRKGECPQKPIKEEELGQMLYDQISRIKIDREVWELGVELLRAKNADEMKQAVKARERLNKDYEKAEANLEKLIDMRINEEITKEEYSTMKKVFLDRKLEIEELMGDRKHSSQNWLELAENFFETAYLARGIMNGDDVEKKRDLIKAVGSNLFLHDKILHLEFNKPFDVLLKPHIREDVQAYHIKCGTPGRQPGTYLSHP